MRQRPSPAELPRGLRCVAGVLSVLFCGIFGLFSGGAVAEQPAAIRACLIDQEPWGSMKTPERSIYGEVYSELSQRTGVPLVISVGPIVRSLEDVSSGFCQFVITSWQSSRADRISRGADFADLDFGVLPRKGLALSEEASLKGLTIATARGLLLGDPFDHDPDIHQVGVYGYEEAIRMTEAGRADGAAGSIISLQRFVRLHGSEAKFGRPLILAHVTLTMQMSRNFAGTDSAKKLNDAVAQLRDSGRATAIIAAYMSDP